MIEPDELRAELARAATADEPPLTLDTDRVVAGGRSRRRRRQALLGAGGALAVAMVVGVPAYLFAGPGIGLSGSGIDAAAGGSIPVTPGAPHNGCAGQTRSGSTQGYALAQWLQPRLPTRQHYQTMSGWQVSYLTDCVDGAKQDSTDVGFRAIEHAGDVQVVLERNTPAEPVAKPCVPADGTIAQKNGTATAPRPSGAAGNGQANASAQADPGRQTGASSPPPSTGPAGDKYVRCETRPLAGGAKLTIEELRGAQLSPSEDRYVSRTVRLWRPDGTVTSVTADNRLVEDGQHSAAQPPLTVNEMIALVQNRDLQLYLPPAR